MYESKINEQQDRPLPTRNELRVEAEVAELAFQRLVWIMLQNPVLEEELKWFAKNLRKTLN